jgi:alanine dehydrogenase
MMALGMAADVTVLDRNVEVLQHLARRFGPGLNTVYSQKATLDRYVTDADLVVGAVLIAGANAPKVVTAEMVRRMRPGSVLVDVAIDQGGCFETSRPTTHAEPTYVVDGVVHYCVANMPGAVPKTSTQALNNVTLPYALALADKGYRQALLDNPHFRNGLNVHAGRITCKAVAEAQGLAFVDPAVALGAA